MLLAAETLPAVKLNLDAKVNSNYFDQNKCTIDHAANLARKVIFF